VLSLRISKFFAISSLLSFPAAGIFAFHLHLEKNFDFFAKRLDKHRKMCYTVVVVKQQYRILKTVGGVSRKSNRGMCNDL